MSNPNKRLVYVDLCKGLLICAVIFGHVLLSQKTYATDKDFTCEFIGDIKRFFFNSYYMPAFFLVTGFCSKFDIDFKSFFIKIFKTIKIPAVTLTAVGLIIRKVGKGVTDPSSYLHLGLIHSWYESDLWFLDSLFLGKLAYWFIYRYIKSPTYRILVCITLFFLAFILGNVFHFKEYGRLWHTLYMILFIAIGHQFKKYLTDKRITFLAIILYFSFILFNIVLNIKQPIITGDIIVGSDSILQLFILSISGSIGILGVCKYLKSNKLLEYCGRNSLVFYCMHIPFLMVVCQLYRIIPTNNIFISVLTYSMFIITTFLFCHLCVVLFNTKYGKYLLGKF